MRQQIKKAERKETGGRVGLERKERERECEIRERARRQRVWEQATLELKPTARETRYTQNKHTQTHTKQILYEQKHTQNTQT